MSQALLVRRPADGPTKRGSGRIIWALKTAAWLSYLVVAIGQMAMVVPIATTYPQDLFQDYVSARQLLAGQPLYPDLAPFYNEYLARVDGSAGTWVISVNAHPPASILVALPVAGLPYPAASWIWEITGVLAYVTMWWLILDGVGLRPTSRRAWRIVAVGALGYPALLTSLSSVSMSPYLSLLLVAVWYLYRRGRRGLAATLLAVAVSLKLYPALLLGVFLLRRDWRTAFRASAVGAGIFMLTLLLFGISAYQHYLSVLSRLGVWIISRDNWSVGGLFGRLLADGGSGSGIADDRALATLVTALMCGAVVSLPSLVALRSGRGPGAATSLEAFDALYSCGLLAMMLVSPLTWTHYSGPAILAWCVLARREFAEAGTAGLPRRLLIGIASGALVLPLLVRIGLTYGSSLGAQFDLSLIANLLVWPLFTYALFAMLLLGVRELHITASAFHRSMPAPAAAASASETSSQRLGPGPGGNYGAEQGWRRSARVMRP